MHPIQRNFDGLWHCLRPAFNSLVPIGNHQISLSGRKFIQQNRSFFQCHINERERRGIRRRGFSRVNRPPISCRHLHNRSINYVYTDLEDKPKRQIYDDERIYDDLRRSANKGDFLRVQTLVNEIVRNRGERPDAQIYLALILVNTSAEHGSPMEVRRLLEEMAAEEIVPDSTIYHAVLKVVERMPVYGSS